MRVGSAMLMVLVALLVAWGAACAGGAVAPERTPAGGETPSAAGETPSVDQTPAAETPAAGGFEQDLEALAEEWAGTAAKLTYRFSSTTDGETDEGEITLYWRPPDAWRMDFADQVGGEGTMIVAQGTSYFCGAGDGEGQCTSMDTPASQMVPFPFLGYFSDPGALSEYFVDVVAGLDINRSQRTIAGEEARCFSAAGTVEGEQGEGEWCFSGDGILLLFASSSSGPGGAEEFRLEATSVSRELSDADFEPPYPVIEVPGLDFLTPGP